jgi:hypothetical protein
MYRNALQSQIQSNAQGRSPKIRRAIAGLLSVVIPMAGASVLPGASQAATVTGSVGGSVFRDLNQNGVKDAGEPPVANLWVRAFGQLNGADGISNTIDDFLTAYGEAKTGANGVWNIASVSSDTKVRVEFYGFDTNNDGSFQHPEVPLPSWLKPAPQGLGNGGSVQFVVIGNRNINYAVASPSDYCQSTPDIVMNCFSGGDPLVTGASASASTLRRFPANATGTKPWAQLEQRLGEQFAVPTKPCSPLPTCDVMQGWVLAAQVRSTGSTKRSKHHRLLAFQILVRWIPTVLAVSWLTRPCLPTMRQRLLKLVQLASAEWTWPAMIVSFG